MPAVDTPSHTVREHCVKDYRSTAARYTLTYSEGTDYRQPEVIDMAIHPHIQ